MKTRKKENLYMRTGLAHSGHFAGYGMEYDDYGDESFPVFPHDHSRAKPLVFPNDKKYNELCGPVIVIRAGERVRVENGN